MQTMEVVSCRENYTIVDATYSDIVTARDKTNGAEKVTGNKTMAQMGVDMP